MPDAHEPPAPTARVVILAGPSGCGKTHLARASGLPIVPLDDFYRDGTDPGLPRNPLGVVDWEDPRCWDADAAVAALARLCRHDAVEVPRYVFGEDRAVGSHVVERHGSPVVIAEGIFAAEIIDALRARGLLADALLIRQSRWVTFLRRLARDLQDGRKSRRYLLRQGWAKTRAEPAVVARQRGLGARPVTKAAAAGRLAQLASPAPDAPPVRLSPGLA